MPLAFKIIHYLQSRDNHLLQATKAFARSNLVHFYCSLSFDSKKHFLHFSCIYIIVPNVNAVLCKKPLFQEGLDYILSTLIMRMPTSIQSLNFILCLLENQNQIVLRQFRTQLQIIHCFISWAFYHSMGITPSISFGDGTESFRRFPQFESFAIRYSYHQQTITSLLLFATKLLSYDFSFL